MSALRESLTEGMEELEADGEMSITLPDGTVSPCTVGLINNDREPMEGGQWVTYEGTATVRLINVKTTPRQGNQVVFNGQTMYVGSVEVNNNLGLMILHIQSTPMPK